MIKFFILFASFKSFSIIFFIFKKSKYSKTLFQLKIKKESEPKVASTFGLIPLKFVVLEQL